MNSNNKKAFFALVEAGLWEREVCLSQFKDIDYSEIYRLAEEQTIVGLVAAGIDHVKDVKVPQEVALTFAGSALQIEQRNNSMNVFIGNLIEKLRTADIYSLLIKGQGIARCYERPLWRSAGDVDLFLSDYNYSKALQMLSTIATRVDKEKEYTQHVAMELNGWEVELHGSLRCGLWKTMDKVLDDVQNDIIYGGAVRSWMNGNTQFFLPREDEDVVFVFSHILQHLFKEGIGLRQICDWCRLLWTFKNKINKQLLGKRIKEMGVLSEWNSLAALSVDYLGMPVDAIPLYIPSKRWSRNASIIVNIIFKTGNFGHNIDKSYLYNKSPVLKRKMITFWRQAKDCIRLMRVFPLNSMKVLYTYFVFGTKKYMKGE